MIVETGAGLPNANSYVSIVDADAYHLETAASWGLATSQDKTTALIKATRYIDGRYRNRFSGIRMLLGQALEWPRAWAIDRENRALLGVPVAIKNAVCEAALIALTDDLTPALERGGQVTEETVGPITTKYAPNAQATTKYQTVDNAIAQAINESDSSLRVSR